jgi:hypothetical protein
MRARRALNGQSVSTAPAMSTRLSAWAAGPTNDVSVRYTPPPSQTEAVPAGASLCALSDRSDPRPFSLPNQSESTDQLHTPRGTARCPK